MKSAMQAVAEAAIAWNKARLIRIAAAKEVPSGALGYTAEEHELRLAKATEARAKAALRKACAAADPETVVLNVEARAPRLSPPPADVIDV